MVFSSQTGAFSPSQFTPSSTTPLTVKQIAAAQLTGPDEEGVPFVADGVETANVRNLLLPSLCPCSADFGFVIWVVGVCRLGSWGW
jgi:hypothetical protein